MFVQPPDRAALMLPQEAYKPDGGAQLAAEDAGVGAAAAGALGGQSASAAGDQLGATALLRMLSHASGKNQGQHVHAAACV